MDIIKITNTNELLELLNNSDLPTADISFETTKNFYGIYNNNILIAAIGIEYYYPTALLRSLVVDENERENGLGIELIKFIEDKCRRDNIEEIYLLTTTAEKYFLKYGYVKIERSEAPENIKKTSQFSDLCPSSSAFMRKILL